MPISKGVAKTFALQSLTTAGVANASALTTQVSKDGGAFTGTTNSASALGTDGTWTIALTASEMNADLVVVKGTNTGCVPVQREIYTESDYTSTRATKLDNLDAAISTRSTYAGGDTSGVTTLVSRITSTRAGLLDNLVHLDADVSSRLAPTTAGRTLDVSIGGEAGIDWANVGSPTTTVNLSGTTISTSQAVASVTDKAGFSLSSSGVDLVLVEAGVNLRQFCSIAGAALAGVVSGAGTGSLVFKSIGGSTTRIAADTDTNGNRTTVALTLPS